MRLDLNRREINLAVVVTLILLVFGVMLAMFVMTVTVQRP
jgi:hypothetical protein